MFELVSGLPGFSLSPCGKAKYPDISTGMGEFLHQIRQAAKDGKSVHIELRRANGTIVSMCSLYLGDPPS